jgi:hypothetical protein
MENAEVLFEMEAKLEKGFPDIKTPSDIDLSDVDERDRLFVTVPIMPVGATSRNGREYNDAIVADMVRQINEERPAGFYGHIPADKRSTHHEPAAIRWVASEISNGTAYGKFIVTRPDAREDIRWAKRTNARIGTSIYGMAEMDGGKVRKITLESIDLAAVNRLGVPEAAARPVFTAEMAGAEGEEDVSEQIAELSGQRDALQTQVGELTARVETAETARVAAETVVSELQTQLAETTQALAELRAGALKRDIDDLVTALVPVEEMRDVVRELVTGADSVDAAKAKAEAFMAGPAYTKLAKALAAEQMGPGAIVAPKAEETSEREQMIARALDEGKKAAAARGWTAPAK